MSEKWEEFYTQIIDDAANQKDSALKDEITSTYSEKETLLTTLDNSATNQNTIIDDTVK